MSPKSLKLLGSVPREELVVSANARAYISITLRLFVDRRLRRGAREASGPPLESGGQIPRVALLCGCGCGQVGLHVSEELIRVAFVAVVCLLRYSLLVFVCRSCRSSF